MSTLKLIFSQIIAIFFFKILGVCRVCHILQLSYIYFWILFIYFHDKSAQTKKNSDCVLNFDCHVCSEV